MSSYEHMEQIQDFYIYFNGNSELLLQVVIYEQKFWNQLCSFKEGWVYCISSPQSMLGEEN
jgi:hypothetical protein